MESERRKLKKGKQRKTELVIQWNKVLPKNQDAFLRVQKPRRVVNLYFYYTMLDSSLLPSYNLALCFSDSAVFIALDDV